MNPENKPALKTPGWHESALHQPDYPQQQQRRPDRQHQTYKEAAFPPLPLPHAHHLQEPAQRTAELHQHHHYSARSAAVCRPSARSRNGGSLFRRRPLVRELGGYRHGGLRS